MSTVAPGCESTNVVAASTAENPPTAPPPTVAFTVFEMAVKGVGPAWPEALAWLEMIVPGGGPACAPYEAATSAHAAAQRIARRPFPMTPRAAKDH
ncbi:MAG: hypothetical protein ACXWBU_04020 [Usitatibacter sp.]